MKAFTLSTCLFALVLLATQATSAPMPMSSVILKLNDNKAARCDVTGSPSKPTAEVVTSALVASGKVACQDAGKHPSGGTMKSCVRGQQGGEDEAHKVLKDACLSNQGKHYDMSM